MGFNRVVSVVADENFKSVSVVDETNGSAFSVYCISKTGVAL
jgi:hypothetical protein